MASRHNKFSNPEEEQDQLFSELEGFIYWMAGEHDNPDNVMMARDDIAGELMIEYVKGVQRYGNLPYGERKSVIKAMLDNRLGELRYRHYITHRNIGNKNLSLQQDEGPEEDLEDWLPADDAYNPEALSESCDRVQATRAALSDPARAVFDAVIFGNKRLGQLVKQSAIRASAVYKMPTIRVYNWHIAEALMISEDQVKEAIIEIRNAYSEVLDGKE